MKVLNKNTIIGFVYALVLCGGLLVAHATDSVTVKKQSGSQITDEQIAIAAVRSAKSSVVNIVGTSATSQINGTGFVIDSNGYIVSNSHVVDDNLPGFTYQVILGDGTKYDAKVLGVDTYNDIALLKIEASNLPVAKLGNSDVLETGQTVFAIGNSLGKYQNTVTRGVVSGTARDVSLGTADNPRPRLQNLIQTDAAINPGNSGGPLINMSGEVIGMSTLIDTAGQGLGFAVPINIIKSATTELRNNGRVSRPYMGITYQTVDSSLKTARNLPTANGALVLQVTFGGPASQAGLRAGDVITQIDGVNLTEKVQIDSLIQKYQAGNQVMLHVFRSNGETDLPLILGEYK